MDPCVTCGTEETTPVCTCDCQCLDTARASGRREIRLLAPTRDTDTAWTENDPIVPEGVLCLVKDRLFDGSLEYFIGDGESKYSELTMLYAGAPLSRTGAENHSPLAASGKSTLDPSWLPDATSSAKGAVMTSTTGAAGKVPIAASGASALDPSWLPAATSSALGGVMTSTTGASGMVPIAGNSGTLDPSWFPEATSSALGAVMASTTKAANNVVKADANGGLDGWKDAIIDAIIADDGSGGLATDSSGNLVVDFNQMPTDKFEALLKSLKMQIPLEADLDLYVDTNHAQAADTIVDGRGTQNKPFKTIQACVNFVTENYALGPYMVRIYVAEGTYTENVRLPRYTTTSGYIIVRALDYAHPPTVTNLSGIGSVFTVSGNRWDIMRLIINGQFSDNGNGKPHNPACINVSGSTASANIYGCSMSAEYIGSAPSASFNIKVLDVDGGAAIGLQAMSGYQNSLSCTKGNASHAYMIHGSRNSRYVSVRSLITDNGIEYEFPCSGTVDAFCYLTDMCQYQVGGSGTTPQFTGTITGKAYAIYGGSAISLPPGGFPGDTGTSVKETDTYCWVR